MAYAKNSVLVFHGTFNGTVVLFFRARGASFSVYGLSNDRPPARRRCFFYHIRNEKTIIKEIKSESGNECGNVKNVNA